MIDLEILIVSELVDSLVGTCLHQWELTAGPMVGVVIATSESGVRFEIKLSAKKLPDA